MATTTRYPIRIPLRLPRPIEPTESPASKPHRPQTPNLPPTLHTSAPCFRSNKRQPTRSNLHSLNSWPAVQCNEGFCNAPQSQCFTLTMTTASQKPHHSANGGDDHYGTLEPCRCMFHVRFRAIRTLSRHRRMTESDPIRTLGACAYTRF